MTRLQTIEQAAECLATTQAIDVTSSRITGSRPRLRIVPEAIYAFYQNRTVTTTRPTVRRRRSNAVRVSTV
jgi:hypothetical protein